MQATVCSFFGLRTSLVCYFYRIPRSWPTVSGLQVDNDFPSALLCVCTVNLSKSKYIRNRRILSRIHILAVLDLMEALLRRLSVLGFFVPNLSLWLVAELRGSLSVFCTLVLRITRHIPQSLVWELHHEGPLGGKGVGRGRGRGGGGARACVSLPTACPPMPSVLSYSTYLSY